MKLIQIIQIEGIDSTLDAENAEAEESLSGHGSGTKISSKELIQAHEYIRKLRQEREDAQPTDQKIKTALDRSKQAADWAAAAYQKVHGLEAKVETGFNDVSNLIQRMARGESLDEPDEPNTHALDEYF